jgi:2-polyprenyl-3-methyl-5-hydroxy-6-metoxy-1,4-benzoquinol methylase
METNGHDSADFPEYLETREIWDRIAEWWDDQIGDGNLFQDVLIEPATERLLNITCGERVLDIACGAGRMARRLARQGAVITAFDGSEKFIQRAVERTNPDQEKIDYRVMDATNREALMTLGMKQFDAAVCTMALMDMHSIEPLLSSLPLLLKAGGRFVFSLMHPAFNSGKTRLIAEEFYREGKLVTESGVVITDYIKPLAFKGIGIQGQPEPQYYFYRPLGLLLNTCFKYGFVMDRFEEPVFPEDIGKNKTETLSFYKCPAIPPILVVRMLVQ